MLHTSFNGLADSSDAVLTRLRALKKPAVSTNYVIHAILSSFVELYTLISNVL